MGVWWVSARTFPRPFPLASVRRQWRASLPLRCPRIHRSYIDRVHAMLVSAHPCESYVKAAPAGERGQLLTRCVLCADCLDAPSSGTTTSRACKRLQAKNAGASSPIPRWPPTSMPTTHAHTRAHLLARTNARSRQVCRGSTCRCWLAAT